MIPYRFEQLYHCVMGVPPDQSEELLMLMDGPMAQADEALDQRRRLWLIEARKKRRWSQTALAKLVGCSQNELSKIETGERLRIDPQIAEAIGNHLKLTREQVMFGGLHARSVRIVGEILGDEVVSMHRSGEIIEIEWLVGDEMEGYRVAVDTLEPRFNRGDILLSRPEAMSFEECYGRECLVEFEGRRYVKHVEPGASVRVVTLRSYRTANPTLVDITPKWIAPVVAIVPVGAPGVLT
jgi:transcriptional regulator with XRE-family HTH domain